MTGAELVIAGAAMLDVDGRGIPLMALDPLLATKRAAGRPKDRIDVEELERIHARR